MDHSNILNNRAQPMSDPELGAHTCPGKDELVFAMRDRHHTFSLDLTTILQCLEIAEREGAVPELPSEWWTQIRGCYTIVRTD
ncbi:hypothetical protein CKO35_15830 [Ectothiorhodospira shaposhnikovii]|uniref:hypothetical protein n=1 Tax=Ectothiorhodospira shaposhnikovii TaxID=1054 RepID=UPI001906FB69|nr:hypothetical protein [Ectothiorhodospira shaposhnikovii]MBK1674734.1 hypothetical protein [Ectothiorhodospira shaposhnikovii]